MNQSTSLSSYTTLRCIPKGFFIPLYGCLFNHVHCCSFYNSQKLETTLHAPEQKNELRKCSTFAQVNVIELLKNYIINFQGKWKGQEKINTERGD